MSERNNTIDIIKGIGIVGMVMGHSGSPVTRFIYLFHMAIFFIASGYCYKESYSDDVKGLKLFAKRRFKTLWLYYVIWTAIFSCLHNFFIDINVYADISLINDLADVKALAVFERFTIGDIVKNVLKACVLHGGTKMGAALWFVVTLLEIQIAYCVVDYVIKKLCKTKDTMKIQLIVAAGLLLAGYGCSVLEYSLFGLSKMLSYYILFYLGVVFRRLSFWQKHERHMILAAIAFLVLMGCYQCGMINLDKNSYENPLFLIITAATGWVFCYELAHFAERISILKNMLICAGKNTMAVVVLHFLCFKIVSYLGVLIMGEELYLVAAFPILWRGGCWWIAYTMVGLVLPIMLSLAWKKVCMRG